MTLVEFLLARIAEDEEAARTCAAVYPAPWEASDRGWVAYVKADAPHFREVARLDQDHIAREDQPEWLGDALAHIARHDPARVLADCEAKRRIVELHAVSVTSSWVNPPDGPAYQEPERTCAICGWVPDACSTVKALASVYADHPDYRSEWAQ